MQVIGPTNMIKNTVVLLDEVLDEIADIANKAESLSIVAKGKTYKITNLDDEDLEVSGY